MKNGLAFYLCRRRGNEFQTKEKSETPHVVSCKSLILFFALTLAANICAADVASNFSAANRFYAKGKFPEAARAYETILQTGKTSPALLFNYGNAEFKSGHLGRAIAAYQSAEQLSPRDPELRANLAFVRNQVQGVTLRESRWQSPECRRRGGRGIAEDLPQPPLCRRSRALPWRRRCGAIRQSRQRDR